MIQGPPGPKGDQGAVGKTGAQGPQGAKGEKGQDGAGTSGVKYVRWGRTTCPKGAQIVYKGNDFKNHHEEFCLLQLLDFFISSDNLLLHIDSNFSEPLEDIFFAK